MDGLREPANKGTTPDIQSLTVGLLLCKPVTSVLPCPMRPSNRDTRSTDQNGSARYFTLDGVTWHALTVSGINEQISTSG